MKKVKAEITVIGNAVGIMRVGDVDYISITDLAKYANIDDPSNISPTRLLGSEKPEQQVSTKSSLTRGGIK